MYSCITIKVQVTDLVSTKTINHCGTPLAKRSQTLHHCTKNANILEELVAIHHRMFNRSSANFQSFVRKVNNKIQQSQLTPSQVCF